MVPHSLNTEKKEGTFFWDIITGRLFMFIGMAKCLWCHHNAECYKSNKSTINNK